MAVLLPMSGAWPVGQSLIGALALAVRDVNANPAILHGKRLEYVWRDDGCDRLKSLAEFSDVLGSFDAIDGLIGPGCGKGCELTAALAQSQNMPQISPTCAAPSLSNKVDFPLFVRTTSPYAKWAPAIVAFMRWAAWTRLSIVADSDMGASVGPLRSEIGRSGFRVGIEKQFESGHFEVAPGDSSPLVSVRAAGVRFVMVYAFRPDYRAIAVEARTQEMSQGWAWMGIDMVCGAENGVKGQDLAVAQAALHGWIYFQPSTAASRDFFDRVKAASIADFGQQLGDDDSTSVYAANLYDAVMLFASTAGKHLEELSNGKLMVQAMMNASFDGKTGRVELDESGDMKESISTINYVHESGTMRNRRIGFYDALSRRYSSVHNGTVVWPGNVHAVPADMAALPTDQGFDTVWLLVGAGATAVVVVSGLVVVIRRRRAQLLAILTMLLTETGMLVLSICMALGNLATDGIVCSSLLRGDLLGVSTTVYTASYVVLLCFGVVVTVLSVGYRLRNARLMHAQLQQVAPQGRAVATGEAHRQAQQSEWELVQTHRTKVTLTLSLASVAAQDLPMSVVNCCLIFVEGSTDKAVVASLLVSVVLLGFKLSAVKRLVQLNQRRAELNAALALLQPKVEAENLAGWLADVEHDAKQREDRIVAMDSPAGRVLDMLEAKVLAKGADMFAVFEASSAGAKQLTHSTTVMYSETKLDAATGLLFGRAAAMVRAAPQEIVAYFLNFDSCCIQSTTSPTVWVRSEVPEHVNAHHTIIFSRLKCGAGVSDRTFLNSVVAKKVEDDPPAYVIVGLPIAQHDKIAPKDEKGAVRAENCQAFKLTEVAAGITKLEYTCSLNLRGSIPQAFTKKVSVPATMNGAPPERLPRASAPLSAAGLRRSHAILTLEKTVCESILVRFDAVPTTVQRYFQQILPLAKCDAGDGQVVGQLLVDLMSSNLKDPARAIREFADRTAMLRDCGFAHIGGMLARLRRADVQGGPDDDTTVIAAAPVTTAAVGPNRSTLTEQQAIAIGCAIASSVHQAQSLAADLNEVVNSHTVLQAMKSDYAWFVPMLNVVMAHKAAEPRGSVVMNRLRSMRSSIAPVAPIGVASDADTADEESGFRSVVPADAHATEVVDSTLAAEPVPAAAALGSALHDARRAQSDS